MKCTYDITQIKDFRIKDVCGPSFLGSSFRVSMFQVFSIACVSIRKVTDEERFTLLVFSNFVLENSPRCYPFCNWGVSLPLYLNDFQDQL